MCKYVREKNILPDSYIKLNTLRGLKIDLPVHSEEKIECNCLLSLRGPKEKFIVEKKIH